MPGQHGALANSDMRRMLESGRVDVFVGVLALLNLVTIGIEHTFALNGADMFGMRIVESTFLVVYLAELAMRFLAYGPSCFKDHWVKLDVLVAVLGALNIWVLEFAFDRESLPAVLFRVARLLRLVKIARLLARASAFRTVLRGLANSATALAYCMITILALLYCFSILGVELITTHSLSTGDLPDADFQSHVEEYFPSVLATMLTLVRFATLDHLEEVYRPLCEKDPWLSLYFMPLILLISIALLNLMAAVMFSCWMDASQQEHDISHQSQEEDWGGFISSLKDMFNRLDEDRSGTLQLHELLGIDTRELEVLCKVLEVRTASEVFRMLDTKKTGTVSINLLFDCILDKVLAKGDANRSRMERQVETMHWRLKDTFAAQHDLGLKIQEMQEQMVKVLAIVVPAESLVPFAANRDPSKDVAPWRARASVQYTPHSAKPPLGHFGRGCGFEDIGPLEADLSNKLRMLSEDSICLALESFRKVAANAKAMAAAGPHESSTSAASHTSRSSIATSAGSADARSKSSGSSKGGLPPGRPSRVDAALARSASDTDSSGPQPARPSLPKERKPQSEGPGAAPADPDPAPCSTPAPAASVPEQRTLGDALDPANAVKEHVLRDAPRTATYVLGS